MKMYTAGYTGHDGYPVDLAEGDFIGEVIEGLPFTVDVDDLPEYPGKVAIPRIVEAIQKHEGSSGWVRQAPYTVMAGYADETDAWSVSWRVSGSSVEDVITAIVSRSDRFSNRVTMGDGDEFFGNAEIAIRAGACKVLVHVSGTEYGYGFNIVGVVVDGEVSASDLKALAVEYSNPEDGVNEADVFMSPTTEVEHAARLVSHYEQERLKAVRRAADEGVSQRVLASLTGVSQATVGRWIKDD